MSGLSYFELHLSWPTEPAMARGRTEQTGTLRVHVPEPSDIWEIAKGIERDYAPIRVAGVFRFDAMPREQVAEKLNELRLAAYIQQPTNVAAEPTGTP